MVKSVPTRTWKKSARYIVGLETSVIIAIVRMDLLVGERTLIGVLKAARNRIFFYDYQQDRYILGVNVLGIP